MEADLVLKEKHSKKNLVSVFNSSSGKVIFTLLTKVISFYMGLIALHVREAGFQRLIIGLFGGSGSFSLQNNFKNLVQVFLSIFGDKKCSDRNNSKI